MTTQDVIDIMVWGSVAALLLAGLVALAAVLIRFGLVSLSERFAVGLRAALLPLAALTALIATLSSLYLSEEASFIPCELCWFQRIAMYPLAAILIIAVLTRDKCVWRYALPISLVGLGVSIYHYWIQVRPDDAPAACSVGVPCSVRYVDQLGFVSIPWMAGSAFLLIAVLLVVERLSRGGTSDEATPSTDEPTTTGTKVSPY